jgi:serralysin
MPTLVRKSGGEVLVNTQTAGLEFFQSVSSLPDGGFVVGWLDQVHGMRAQRFDAAGIKLGGEIEVNAAAYEAGRVAGLSTGGFVATWNEGFDGLKARVFDSNGVASGNAFFVNATPGLNDEMDVMALPGGRFLVSWVDEDSFHVNAQIFDATGVKVGLKMDVDGTTGGFQPAGIALAAGGFLLAWSNQQGGTDDPDASVRGQLFDEAGNKVGGNFLINTTTAGGQFVPDIAALPSGGFVAAWQSANGGPSEARAQIFDALGNKVGAELLASEINRSVTRCKVTALPWGGFLVGWEDDGTPNHPGVYAQLFDGDGNRLGSNFQVNTAATDYNSRPDFTTLLSGEVVAVWTNETGNGPEQTGVKSQIMLMPTLGTAGTDDMTGSDGDDSLAGLNGNDHLHGGGGMDALDGGVGNDVLDGGAGQDSMWGNAGDDTYFVDDAGDQVFEAAGQGFDQVYASVSYALAPAQSVELLATSDPEGTAAINLTGNELAQQLIGNAGANVLDGGAGADTMTGGNGNDIYMVDNVGDSVIEFAGGGIDEIRTSLASYTLGDNVEKLTGLSSLGQTLIGNAASNVLNGGSGNDILDGRAGQDTMAGGSGNDIYNVDDAADQVLEAANQGKDTVYASVSYTLGAGQSIETLSTSDAAGTTAINLTGNNLGQTIIGNAGANVLTGGGGADYLLGLGGDDTLVGNADANSTLQGGTGNDFYYVNRTGDSVLEAGGEGSDRVYASVSFTLSGGQEIEVLAAADAAATTALVLAGNNLGQFISGNAGANTLIGGGGNDYLLGLGGDDILVGNADAASTLQGGTGDDWYYVYRTGDSIIEFAGEGSDRILSAVNYTLSAGQEIETLTAIDPTATTAINLTGNALGQNIFGNAGANTLTGGGGADYLLGLGGDDILIGNADAASTLQGGIGNDTYYITRTGDSIIEFAGEGSDRLLTSVSYTLSAGQEIETLSAADQNGNAALDLAGNDYGQLIFGTNGANTMSGNGGADQLAGFGGDDILLGGDGDDLLNGGAGHDVLNGGAGADLFVFADALGGGNVDAIQDFASGADRILLDHGVFTGLATGVLASSAFVLGTAAQDADDRIIYNQATGELWFDADGNGAGAAVLYATLSGSPAAVASDFVVV